MKFNAQSLVPGICLVLMAAATVPANAQYRGTTAFTSFHVRYPLNEWTPYSCINESYGAAVNNCPYQVGLMFDLPVNQNTAPSGHDIWVSNYALGTGTNGATCYAWSYDGNGNGKEGTSGTFSAKGAEVLMIWVNPSWQLASTAVLCDVPPGEGIGALTWTP